jgi:hypothetical protein
MKSNIQSKTDSSSKIFNDIKGIKSVYKNSNKKKK